LQEIVRLAGVGSAGLICVWNDHSVEAAFSVMTRWACDKTTLATFLELGAAVAVWAKSIGESLLCLNPDDVRHYCEVI
jgi:hypothetical protein